MIVDLRLTASEIQECLEALTQDGRYASPSLCVYLRGKEEEARGSTQSETKEIDPRILELAKTNSIVYAGITMARHNQLPEKEALIRLVQVLANTNKMLTDELIRIRSRGPTEVVAV